MKKILLTLTTVASLFTSVAQANEIQDPKGLLPDLIEFIGNRPFDRIYQLGDQAKTATYSRFNTEDQVYSDFKIEQREVIAKEIGKVVIRTTDILTGEYADSEVIEDAKILEEVNAMIGQQLALNMGPLAITEGGGNNIKTVLESTKYMDEKVLVVLTGTLCMEENRAASCTDYKFTTLLNRAASELRFVEMMRLDNPIFNFEVKLK